MQANRINVSRRAPWRIALDALARVWPGAKRALPERELDAPFEEPQPPAAAAPATPVLPGVPEATLGAVDFLAQLDDALRFQYVSDASIEFIGYHRDYLSMLTLHDLVASEEADELHALVARRARAASSNRRR